MTALCSLDSASVHPPESNPPASSACWNRVSCSMSTPASRWRHGSWSDTRTLVFRALHRTMQPITRIVAFEDCGSTVFVLRDLKDPDHVCLAGSGCHDRFCLPCANSRSRLIARRVLAKLGGQRSRFLTLTLRTGNEPLADSLDELYRSFAALRRSPDWLRCVDGGVAFLEIKWSPQGRRWHPHLHCLIQGRYFPHAIIKARWLKITRGSSVVDIRDVKSDVGAARYVTKYASKPFNSTFTHETDLLDEAVLALRGRRLALTFGTWRGYRLTLLDDTSGWQSLGTLDDVLARARRGDSDAADALECLPPLLLEDYLGQARSPPDPPSARFHSTPKQSLLFSLYSHR